MVSIFTYGLNKAKAAFAEAGLEYYSLTDFDTICEVAAETGYISETEIGSLKAFRDSL